MKPMLLYILGKNFLAQEIPDHLYDAHIQAFSDRLLLLFTGDDLPEMVENEEWPMHCSKMMKMQPYAL